MEIRIAKIISYLFHPLLMPTYGFALLFYTNNYISTFTAPEVKLVILGITFVFTFLLPAFNVLILLKTGRIKSLEMETNSERLLPYISTTLYYFALFYLFFNAGFPSVFKVVVLGAAICLLLTLLINLKWKISAHAIGIGGTAGVILGIIYRLRLDLELIFMFTLFLAGIIGFARLKLNAHSPAQVYTGFLLGFLVELLLMIFY
ncbi:MAG: phosphatase PAP2 family protein [Bacteroidia bacterium]